MHTPMKWLKRVGNSNFQVTKGKLYSVVKVNPSGYPLITDDKGNLYTCTLDGHILRNDLWEVVGEEEGECTSQ